MAHIFYRLAKHPETIQKSYFSNYTSVQDFKNNNKETEVFKVWLESESEPADTPRRICYISAPNGVVNSDHIGTTSGKYKSLDSYLNNRFIKWFEGDPYPEGVQEPRYVFYRACKAPTHIAKTVAKHCNLSRFKNPAQCVAAWFEGDEEPDNPYKISAFPYKPECEGRRYFVYDESITTPQLPTNLERPAMSKLFDTRYYVNNVEIHSRTPQEIYTAIADAEQEIKNLETIEHKPASLIAEIADRKAQITALVSHLDAKTAETKSAD